jgi:hypothetical protein
MIRLKSDYLPAILLSNIGPKVWARNSFKLYGYEKNNSSFLCDGVFVFLHPLYTYAAILAAKVF